MHPYRCSPVVGCEIVVIVGIPSSWPRLSGVAALDAGRKARDIVVYGMWRSCDVICALILLPLAE